MPHDNILNEISNSQLNLDKLFTLGDQEKSIIHSLYKELLNEFSDRSLNIAKIFSLYNTLKNYDFLITNREKNIDSILQNK